MCACTKFQLIWRTSELATKFAQNYRQKFSVILKNFRFWEQICPENMNEKSFEKKNKQTNIKTVINI